MPFCTTCATVRRCVHLSGSCFWRDDSWVKGQRRCLSRDGIRSRMESGAGAGDIKGDGIGDGLVGGDDKGT